MDVSLSVFCVLLAVGTGQMSLFGNNKTLGSTLGTMGAFGPQGFSTGTSTLGFGAQQQPVGKYHFRLPPLSPLPSLKLIVKAHSPALSSST